MLLSIQYSPNCRNKEFPNTANQLLSFLSEDDRQNLVSNSHRLFLSAKTILHKPNEPIKTVYFPLQGIISLLKTNQEGLISEIIEVSNEGMVGIASFLGGHFLPSFAVTQTNCVVISLNVDLLKQEFARGGELQQILLLYTQALFSQVSQNVFCSCHHTIQQRLARWLLFFSDRLKTRELLLTQETLADLLGVRRSSLSVVANKFRHRSLIDYSRGRIIILKSAALRKVSCDCDRIISGDYSRLFHC